MPRLENFLNRIREAPTNIELIQTASPNISREGTMEEHMIYCLLILLAENTETRHADTSFSDILNSENFVLKGYPKENIDFGYEAFHPSFGLARAFHGLQLICVTGGYSRTNLMVTIYLA
ncbi:hypothetical protein SUGI_1096790 [Cryptomeria japonica]|nr:hypothetical protein SUGI_1096790 [Cryptomeria japonica]